MLRVDGGQYVSFYPFRRLHDFANDSLGSAEDDNNMVISQT